MPPFFEQVARLLRPGGLRGPRSPRAGPTTPFYTPAATLERGFERQRPRDGRRRVRPAPGRTTLRGARERTTARFAILMNPTRPPGASRCACCPSVQQELDAAGAEHRVVETRDMAPRHARGARGGRARRGRRRAGRRRARRHARRRAARLGAARRRCRPAAATTSRARSGSRRTSPAPAACSLDGVRKALDLGEANGRPFACIASMGYDSEANRIANEARLVRGNLVYAYAAIRALMAWKPARFTVRLDGARAPLRGLHRRGRQHRLLRRRHEHGAGRGPLRRPARGRDASSRSRSCASSANLPKVFKGTHVERGRRSACTARARSRSPRTGRSTCTRTASRSRRCPATVTARARRPERDRSALPER